MKKLLATLALLALSSAASASWIQVGEIGDLKIHADPTTVTMTAPGKFRVWEMMSSPVAKSSGYKSSKTYVEMNCREGSRRVVTFMLYSDEMGYGNIVHRGNGDSIGNTYPTPDSPAGFLMRTICATK